MNVAGESSALPSHSAVAAAIASEGWYEKLYHMLLDGMPYTLLLIDRGLRVVSANRNFYEKARRNEADTIGAPLRAVFPGAILDFTDLETKVRGVLEGGQPLQGAQMTYRAPGIQTRMYHYTVVPVKSGVVVQHAMLLMEDITEKVQLTEQVRVAERHLTSVVESANDLVVSTCAEGRVISWNMAAERISGYRKTEVRGLLLADLFELAQHDQMAMIIHGLTLGEFATSQEFNLVTRSGKQIPVDWSLSPIHDDAGRVAGVVAVGRDLSERRAFEKHIYESEELSALGVMAGGIAHEVRNPLSVSYSAAQFLLDPTRDPAFQRECVEKIISGIDRASTIIENLLRFARPSPADIVESIDLVALVHATASVVTPQAKLQKIRIVVANPDGAVPISGNPHLLQQVIMNLLLNAVQAMPEGGEILATIHHPAGVAMAVIVDTGCGISAANIARIFDPFFTTQPVGKGTGLGLSICDTIVKQHGGSISVQSVEGAGSTFTVRLPLQVVDG